MPSMAWSGLMGERSQIVEFDSSAPVDDQGRRPSRLNLSRSSSSLGKSTGNGRRHEFVAGVGAGLKKLVSGRKVSTVEKAEGAFALRGASTCASLVDARRLHGQWLEEHKSDEESMAYYKKFVSSHHAQKIVSLIVEATTSGHTEEVPWATQLLVGALGIESHDQMQVFRGELVALKDERFSLMGELAALESELAEARKKREFEQLLSGAFVTKLRIAVADVSTQNAKAAKAFTPGDVVKFMRSCPCEVQDSSNAQQFTKGFMKMYKVLERCSADLQGLIEDVETFPCCQGYADLRKSSKGGTDAVPEHVGSSAIRSPVAGRTREGKNNLSYKANLDMVYDEIKYGCLRDELKIKKQSFCEGTKARSSSSIIRWTSKTCASNRH